MRRCSLVVCAVLLFVSGCDAEQPSLRGPQGTPVASVALQRFDIGTGDFVRLTRGEFSAGLQTLDQAGVPGLQLDLLADGQVLLVTLELDQFQPRLLDPSVAPDGELTTNLLLGGTGRAKAAAGSWRAQHSVLVGSFFVAGFAPLQPLGLLQVNGRTLNPLQPHGYTRILGLQNTSLGVVHRGGFHRGQFASAVQVGPGIIEAGRLDINPTEVQLPQYLRSFVGVCGERALLGVSFEPMHLYSLGQLLVSHMGTAAGLACDEVVNLSGDRETLLVLPEPTGKSLLVYGDPQAPKSALLGFVGNPAAVLPEPSTTSPQPDLGTP